MYSRENYEKYKSPKFERCLCGSNLHNIGTGVGKDKIVYMWYVCKRCGRSSAQYKSRYSTEAKKGWNRYIQEIREWQEKTKGSNLNP